MSTELRTRLSDSRGNPSRWVALGFALLFGLGAVVAACVGQGGHVTAVLAFMFLASFNVAFGRRPMTTQVVGALGRLWPGGASRQGPP